MPFNVFTSQFTMVNGATNASNGQIIQAPVWDSIFSDIQTGLTQCFTQFGIDATEQAFTTGSVVQLGNGSVGLRASITGAGTITGFGSVANQLKLVRFLTQSIAIQPSGALLTPGSLAMTTQVGDQALVTSDANANFRVVSYETQSSWNTYQPTLGSGAGSFSVAAVSGRYQQIGKTITARITVIVTTVGTASGKTIVSLPFAPNTAETGDALPGFSGTLNGSVALAAALAGTGLGMLQFNGSTAIGAGATLAIGGTYEAA